MNSLSLLFVSGMGVLGGYSRLSAQGRHRVVQGWTMSPARRAGAWPVAFSLVNSSDLKINNINVEIYQMINSTLRLLTKILYVKLYCEVMLE